MRGRVLFVLSVISVAFFTFSGAFFDSALVFEPKEMNAGGTVAENCVYELYLYQKSSGCEILSFNTGEKERIRIEKFKFGRAVKGERLFIPAAEFSSDGLNEEETQIVGRIIENLNAEKVFCESGEKFYCEYYYSPSVKSFSIINGKKVNVHISYTNAGVSFSSPMAFGSY